jgi:hypothetical protein
MWTGCLFTVFALALRWPYPPDPPSALVDIHGVGARRVVSSAFLLPSAQDVDILAVGAESQDQYGTMTLLKTGWNGKKVQLPWTGNAWILDLKTRAVVWELSAAHTSASAHDTRTFSGSVRLPAGSYEAFYASFPEGTYSSDDRDKKSLIERLWYSSSRDTVDGFAFVIRADGLPMNAHDVARANEQFDEGSIVNLHGTAGQQFQQTGFSLERPTSLDIYAVGEAREDGEFDTGWIINADTRQKVWKLAYDGSATAGGADKNRMAHVTKTLPAGRYAAFYATDDSHDPSAWNAAPPHDPESWGLLIRVPNATDRASVKHFAYENVPDAATFVALTDVGDSQAVSRGFTLTRPMDVRIYAIGEGRDGKMFDYGWIVNANGHRRVWDMPYDDTEPAGGAAKNRLVDRVVHFEKGDYTVYYVTDGSHSAEKWNASAPPDGRRWGITLLSAEPSLDRAAVTSHAETPDPSILAQLVRVRNDERPHQSFTLAQASDVRIYALGEGVGGEMVDYGWIEDAKSGRTVWEMTYRTTERGGGASKNRRFEGTIKLPAGAYVLHYCTDDSHAFGEWNADPPDDPISWGITIYRPSHM